MISQAEVVRIAKLAKLQLAADEIALYQQDLNNFIASSHKLREVDVSSVDRTSHAVVTDNVLRSDNVSPSFPQTTALLNGPSVVEGYFRVPQVMEVENGE